MFSETLIFLIYLEIVLVILYLFVSLLGHWIPRGKPPGTHFIGGWVGQSGHEGVKKNLHPSDTRDRTRAVQPVVKRLAAWATWPTKLNPWYYSSEETRPTEAVAAIWQYRGLVVSKALSLNLNFSFLNRITLLLISSSYPIGLTRLGAPRSRPYTSKKNF